MQMLGSDELISLETVITEFIAWVLSGLQVLRHTHLSVFRNVIPLVNFDIKVLAGELQT